MSTLNLFYLSSLKQ